MVSAYVDPVRGLVRMTDEEYRKFQHQFPNSKCPQDAGVTIIEPEKDNWWTFENMLEQATFTIDALEFLYPGTLPSRCSGLHHLFNDRNQEPATKCKT